MGRGSGEGVDACYFLGSYWAGQVWEELLRVPLGELEADIITMPGGGSQFPKSWFVSRGIFYFQILDGSSHCLERFWARYPISRAEWAGQPFSVVVRVGRPSVRNQTPGAPLTDCS